MRLQLCGSVAAILLGMAAPALAWPMVCAPAGVQLTFTVAFSASWENGLYIRRTDSNAVVHTFNNYFGNGAGGEWNQGAGSWTTPIGNADRCYRLVGMHKNSGADPGQPWRNSEFRINGNRVGFEDGGDDDFNDTTVRVTFSGPAPIDSE